MYMLLYLFLMAGGISMLYKMVGYLFTARSLSEECRLMSVRVTS